MVSYIPYNEHKNVFYAVLEIYEAKIQIPGKTKICIVF